MTRKDYLLIAKVFKAALSDLDDNPAPARVAVVGVIHAMSVALASENPTFDPRKFFSACGLIQTEQTK